MSDRTERLALTEEVIVMEERFGIMMEQTHCKYNLHEKFEEVEKSVLESRKQV